MQATLTFEGEHVKLATAEEMAAGARAAAAVFAEYRVDPLDCTAAIQKLAKDELLSREEALMCVIWDAADDKAFRALTLGWLIRDIDIRLVANHTA